MRKATRFAVWGLAVVVVLAVVAVVGLKAYLASNGARQLAAGKLTDLLGEKVVVTELDAGLVGSTGVVIEVPAQPPASTTAAPADPVLSGRVLVNVSAAGLAAGQMPTAITVEGAKLTLRFDAAGNLLDKLPDPKGGGGGFAVPDVTLKQAAVRVIQEGRPEFQISGVDATLKPAGDRLAIAGKADDPSWGKWTLSGDAAADGSTAAVTLKTDAIQHLGMAQLRSLPLISPAVWKAIELEGDSPAEIKVGRPAGGEWGYHIDLEPRNTRLVVHPVGMTFTDATAKVGIDGMKITLAGFRGKSAGGEATADGTGDFGQSPYTVNLKVDAKGMDVGQLPKTWKLPRVEEGRLRGSADLTLKIAGDDVQPHGSGKGVIDMKLLGGTGQLDVQLVGDGKNLQFQQPGEKTSLRSIANPEGVSVNSQGWSAAEPLVRDTAVAPTGRPLRTIRVAPLGLRDDVCGDSRGSAALHPWLFPDTPSGLAKTRTVTIGRTFLVAVAALLLQAPAAPAQEPAPKDDPTVVRANLKLKDVDLAQLLARLNVAVPIRLAGKINVDVAAEIPLTEARTLKAYRVRGKVTVPSLDVQDLSLKDVLADINFSEGVLTVNELSAKVPNPGQPAPGTVRGSARFGVDPRGDLSADLKLNAVPLGEVVKAAPDLAGKVAGLLSGNLTFRLPGDKLTDVSAAVADGALTSPGLTVYGRNVGATNLTLKLRDGVARISDATTTVEGLPITANASLTLKDKYPFEATVNTKPTDVAELGRLAGQGALPVDVRGKVELTANATGSLKPLAYHLGGRATAADLAVGTAPVGQLAFNYDLSDNGLSLTDLRAEAFQGTATGRAKVPFRETDAGDFHVDLKDLNASAMTKAIPSLPVKLDGRVGGTVSGTLPPTTAGKPRQATVAVDVQAPKLRVQGIPTDRLRGKVDYKPGLLAYKLTGDSLGGTFDLDGTYPLANADAKPKDGNPPPPAPPVEAAPPDAGASGGTIRLDNVRLGGLAGALDANALAPLRGRLSLVVRYRYDADGRGPFGEGDVQVRDFGWAEGGRDRSDLRAAVRVTPEAVEVADLTGQLAGGNLRGRVRYNLANPARSFYTLVLDRANATRLLSPLGISTGAGRNTELTVAVRGTLGRELRGAGTVTAGRAALGGTAVSDLRVPFEYSFAPGGGGQVAVRDLNAQAAGGRVTGQATYHWGSESRLDGDLRLVNVGVRQLIGTSTGVTAGRVNGRFNFSGRNVKTVNDVTGQLVASFGDPNPFDAPVLRQLQPFLSPAQLVTPFSEGDIRARLAGGVFRVERFTLTSTNLQLYADGSVGLNGRLDLDFKARTGQVGADFGALRLFGLRIPAIGPIPLTLVVEISRFLSNRMVLLKVTGTLDQPSVQVNVAALLAEEAIRYFLGGYNPLNFQP